MKNIQFNFIHYVLIVEIILSLISPLHTYAQTSLFIGTNNTGAIGYLHLKQLPINQLYSVLEVKNIHCGGYVSGYTERQENRFIIHTDVPDPRKDDLHQCAVTFIQKKQVISIIKEENCEEWHDMGCAFTSLQFPSVFNKSSSQ